MRAHYFVIPRSFDPLCEQEKTQALFFANASKHFFPEL